MKLSISEISGSITHCSFGENFVDVYVAEIEPAEASKILQLLSVEMPLQQYGLRHLKRVSRRIVSEIEQSKPEILSESQDCIGEISLKDCNSNASSTHFLEVVLLPVSAFSNVSTAVKSVFPKLRICSVARFPPQTRAEFESWGGQWPLVFRPSEIDRVRAKGLDGIELKYLEINITALLSDEAEVAEIRSNYVSDDDIHSIELSEASSSHTFNSSLQDKSQAPHSILATMHGGVIVNSSTGQIVATSASSLRSLLSTHGASVLSHPLYAPAILCVDAVAAAVRKMEEGMLADEQSVGISTDQYLCTGLDLILTTEPDLFSAMALVHSRIRRVTFMRRDPHNGALGSVTSLHSLRALNHRFRAFHATLEPPELPHTVDG